MPPHKGLTELESCTLGVIRQHQPCSTYKVRSVFAASHTTEWSASAGSIYPVIERLRRLRLVKVAGQRGDARGRRDLTLTAKGEQALLAWMMGMEEWVARATPDPIRTRICFLDYLASARDRAAFLDLAEALTRAMLAELQVDAEAARSGPAADYLSVLGAQFQLEARLRWLGVVRAAAPGP